jgi:hypothetical protein
MLKKPSRFSFGKSKQIGNNTKQITDARQIPKQISTTALEVGYKPIAGSAKSNISDPVLAAKQNRAFSAVKKHYNEMAKTSTFTGESMNQYQYDHIKLAAYNDELQKIAAEAIRDEDTGNILLPHWRSVAAVSEVSARHPFKHAGNVLGGMALGGLAGAGLGAAALSAPEIARNISETRGQGKILKFLEKNFSDLPKIRQTRAIKAAVAGVLAGGALGIIPGAVAGDQNFYNKRGVKFNPLLGPLLGRVTVTPQAQKDYSFRKENSR